ncbi:uncharacterized protein LOC131597658 [Vicia villosa]|uniref:uncharacterized protein LOC131597658 n=1 Tax=Vicia villosa TaxID=3911 RepID=UPI00273CB300|nr:uncharacterized protein LOC131597658 [Vicia villosa]
MRSGRGSRRGRSCQVSSFFVTSFPKKYSAKDLYHVFESYGDVDEVIIPSKRNIRGNRYGFVRFFDVEDDKRLATKLDKIFLEDRKIYVNIPRFSRRMHVDSEKPKRGDVKKRLGVPRDSNPDVVVKETKLKPVIIKGDDRSFAQVVSRNAKKMVEVSSGSVQGRGMENHVLVNVVFDDLDSLCFSALHKALVGVVEIPSFSFELQDALLSEGFFSIVAIQLGPNLCLLSEKQKGCLYEFIENGGCKLNQWFKVVKKWEPQDVDDERVVWVRCFGVPCHVWGEIFFQSFGVFFCVDEATKLKSSMEELEFFFQKVEDE